MKIRNGFVSNSSSSSFIINCVNETKNVRDVATLMIKKQIEQIELEKWGDWEEHIKIKEQRIKDLESIDDSLGVHFPSVNYDTWIKKVCNQILISTCNNEDWYLPNQESISEETKEELLKFMSQEEVKEIEEYGELYISDNFKDFYSLEFGIVGTEVDYDFGDSWDDYRCKRQRKDKNHISNECGCHLWHTKLGVKCPICDKGLFERKEKLERIEKISK